MRCPCFLLCWEVEPHTASQKAAPRSVQPGQAGSRVASVPRTPGPLPRSQQPSPAQPSRGVLCSPGTAGSQVIARTLQKSLESMRLCSVAPAVASSHPLRVCRPAAVRGAVPLPTAGRGQPSITSVTPPAAPGRAGQDRTGKPFNPDLSPHPLPACYFSLVFIKYLPPFAFEHHFHYPCTDPTIKNVNMA